MYLLLKLVSDYCYKMNPNSFVPDMRTLVFVIDASYGMKYAVEVLAAALPAFIQQARTESPAWFGRFIIVPYYEPSKFPFPELL